MYKYKYSKMADFCIDGCSYHLPRNCFVISEDFLYIVREGLIVNYDRLIANIDVIPTLADWVESNRLVKVVRDMYPIPKKAKIVIDEDNKIDSMQSQLKGYMILKKKEGEIYFD